MPSEGKIFRIIDANINRATEGLRVVEEICRFVLEDEKITLDLKKLRGWLSKNIRVPEYQKKRIRGSEDQILKAREAERDIGRKIYTKDEGKRKGLEDIFAANIKRAQEAVRCLEEFSKLINAKLGRKFKDIRFELYALEKEIALRLSRYIKLDFNLYVITDPEQGHVKTAKKVLAEGVKMIQLRDKKANKEQLIKWGKQIRNLTRRWGAAFIINDYIDLAQELSLDGVHLGQEDASIARARKKLGPGKIIGVSTHNLAQALKAEKAGADYIAVGPIFSTPTKPQAQPVGLGLLKKVIQKVKIPVVAIGGIDQFNIRKILKTGCRRVAVVRAAREIKQLKQQLED